MKLPKDKWGAPIYKGMPQSPQQISPNDVSEQGLLYPKTGRQTMGEQSQTQFTAKDMIVDAMSDIGETAVSMGS